MKILADLLRNEVDANYDKARELYKSAIRIRITNEGYNDKILLRWIASYGLIDCDMENFELCRIKLEYSYNLMIKLGYITTMPSPFALAPVDNVPVSEGSVFQFPGFPYGHELKISMSKFAYLNEKIAQNQAVAT